MDNFIHCNDVQVESNSVKEKQILNTMSETCVSETGVSETGVFEFDVNFPPTSLKRHRHTKAGHTYDPSSKEKKEFVSRLSGKLPSKLFAKPIQAELYFYEKRPKSHYRSGKFSDELKSSAPKRNVVKKDIDNFVKFVFDSLNKKVYLDDSQIFELKCGKYYTDREDAYIKGVFREI